MNKSKPTMKSPTFLVSAISIESRWKIIGEAPNYACARESARFAGLWYSRDFEPAETTACNCDCVIWQSFNGAAVLKPRREQNNNSIRGLYMGFNGAAVYKPRRDPLSQVLRNKAVAKWLASVSKNSGVRSDWRCIMEGFFDCFTR